MVFIKREVTGPSLTLELLVIKGQTFLPYATANGGWCSLPVDLLHQVYGRLTSERDVLHFRQVCTHWRASGSVPVAPFRPWVVARRAKPISVGPMGEYSLWLPRGPRRIQVAGPHDLPFCYGTPLGWLALADDELFPSRLRHRDPAPNSGPRHPGLPLVVRLDGRCYAGQERGAPQHLLLAARGRRLERGGRVSYLRQTPQRRFPRWQDVLSRLHDEVRHLRPQPRDGISSSA
jgi:hypothetical protein